MAKQLINFVCQECGYDSPQWLGKCPECGNWNTFKEFKSQKLSATSNQQSVKNSFLPQTSKTPRKLSEITKAQYSRLPTTFSEMDGVLGGGIVPGSVTLLAGDPGIGKSTLLLQLALSMSNKKVVLSKAKDTKESQGKNAKEYVHISNNISPVLYVSGEESEEQVKLRADRIAKVHPDNFLLLSLTNTDILVETIADIKPSLVIIDSIQTMEAESAGGLAGSVSQVRYAAQRFIQVAKELGMPFIIVGHVTKEGMVAGPMVLSHMVDCVLFLEGEKFTSTRVLRSLKNRFGPVDEVGIFLMEGEGMTQVSHPEQLFLTNKDGKAVPGSVMVVTMEGSRAFLVELQALVVYSKLAYPRRITSGIDARRLELLLAVLQKHCKLPVETTDVFVNVAGGLKISDPAIDVGICLAIYSSFKNIPLHKTVGIAEVGLLGELRMVPNLSKRIKESEKLGFKTIISANSHKSLSQALARLEK